MGGALREEAVDAGRDEFIDRVWLTLGELLPLDPLCRDHLPKRRVGRCQAERRRYQAEGGRCLCQTERGRIAPRHAREPAARWARQRRVGSAGEAA